jgi:hypothetical protein
MPLIAKQMVAAVEIELTTNRYDRVAQPLSYTAKSSSEGTNLLYNIYFKMSIPFLIF